MAKVVILGAGVMGSAMAMPAAARGNRVALVGTDLDADTIRSVQGNGWHPRLALPMPEGVTAHPAQEFGDVLGDDTDLLVLGVSSTGVPWAIDRLAETLRRPVAVLMITKGLGVADGTLQTLPEAVRRGVEERTEIALSVMAVGGPCIAGELAAERDTSVVVAGGDRAAVERAIALLDAPFYHARASADLVGVEVCAAFKNFFAIAVGSAAGWLEREGEAPNGALAHNLSASLFAQSLQELRLLVEALGGTRESVEGLPGAGDLYVTCQAGRNARMGRLLGLGLSFREAKAEHMPGDTVEGADLALAVGPTLEAMWADGRLPAERMPLSRALLQAIARDAPFEPRFVELHR